jgi:hypothetical protein
VAWRERANISDRTLDQIAANWGAALLGETTVPLEAVALARELLGVAFYDRRPAWAAMDFQKTRFFVEKHWISLSAGGTIFLVSTEEKTAFGQTLNRLPSAEKVNHRE